MTRFAELGRRGLLYVLLLQLGAMSLAWNVLATLLHPLLPERRATQIGRAVIARAYRSFWATAHACGMLQIEASALDALHGEPGGLIVAANHPTMLDALVLVARLPRGVCIMKADLMHNVFLGAGARFARYICNDSPHAVVRRAVGCLREGAQLVMFPEGTRTTRAPLNPFQGGFALIARRAGVPVQTVFIDTTSPYLGKGWPLWRLPPVPIEFSVRLGRRFEPGADLAASVQEIERYMAAGVRPLARHTEP